ncbi:MAG: mechanosensitive ion channel [Thermoanaerobaculia bacterium]|nr:mechanosensitive ion channel [Thermoanaerobaculia bacterium]
MTRRCILALLLLCLASSPVVLAQESLSDAASSAASAAADQTRDLWEQIFVPMGQRIATGLPVLGKALLLLFLFWVVAGAAGAAVRKLLDLTNLDERAAKDWGLESVLRPEGEKPRSIGWLVGRITKWLILLLGFVAFFQTMGLGMVAGPLQNIVDRVLGVIPNLLYAAVILFAYWVIASLARFGVTKFLTVVKFDERAGKRWPSLSDEEGETPTGNVGRLVFYLVLALGLLPFLEALGQEALLEPVERMIGEALAFIPNIVGALVIFFIGRAIAAVVREIVSSFLGATGLDALAERLGMEKVVEDRKLSALIGSVAYFFVLVPVMVAAVDTLGIRAISEPVEATLTRFLEIVPLAFAAALLIAIGYVVARLVRDLVRGFLESVGADQLPAKLGLSFLQPKEGQPSISKIVSGFVMFLILLFTVGQAFATLQLEGLALLVGSVIAYLPWLLSGVAIILVGLSLSGYVGRMVESAVAGHAHAGLIGKVARVAILFLAFSIGVAQLGIAEDIVAILAAAVLGGVALGLGLAFGLGGKDRAKDLVDRL